MCQRENDFYVGTVRAFRDRRYEYKTLNKQWKGKLDAARAARDALAARDAADMVVLYDSLQLAHKCILNSFYGYVMRRGARWYSMEMAGVVTYTGAQIIQRAADLVCGVGMPLELDTDGIWCCLPSSFPENLVFETDKGKKVTISYPCAVLNVMVARHNTNDQYADLIDADAKTYATSSQMTIEFEVDGPYRAMILPASKEEGRLIKKRYAVFNPDGSLAELKGFELKRRGELKLIKCFQAEVFSRFLEGDSLPSCYAAVASVADRWLDLLDTRGAGLDDDELTSYISESSTMSKALHEYEGRKSCAVTTARRLASFLGDARIKDKGLNCNYVVSARPLGAPTSERAVPVAVFATEPAVARAFLRRWCGDLDDGRPATSRPDIRAVVDWDYYRERLGSAIQKIVTIPAAMQRVANPVPRVRHPDWLHRRVREKEDRLQQRKLDGFFVVKGGGGGDIEDGGRALAREAPARAALPPPPPRAPSPPPPPRSDDIGAWVAAHKRKWRAAVAARKKARAAAATAADRGAPLPGPAVLAPTRGVGAMLAKAAAAAASTHWQVLGLDRTGDPRALTLWALAGDAMHRVPLRVPATFYLASTAPAGYARLAALGAAPARREPPFAPLGEGAVMYAASPPPSMAPDAIDALLAAPHVRGVWERGLDPVAAAALAVGCVATLAPHARSKSLADGLDLGDLVMRTTAECDYLEGGGAGGRSLGGLRHVSFFARLDAARSRGLLAAHCPAAGAALVVVIVAGGGGGGREVGAASVERAWREAAADAAARAPPGAPEPDAPPASIEVRYAPDAATGYKLIQRALAEWRDAHRGPAAALVDARGGAPHASRAVPALRTLPCVDVPLLPGDAGEAAVTAAALGWQAPAARAAAAALAAGAATLAAAADRARYAHLPLSCLGSDWRAAAADALLARTARDAGVLLWGSPLAAAGAGTAGAAARDPAAPPAAAPPPPDSDAPPPDVLAPGAYRGVCVQLRLYHLLVAALDGAPSLADADGGPVDGGGGPAARALRRLVHAWIVDATQHGSPHADDLLLGLGAWLRDSSRGFHARPLAAAASRLTSRMLASLLASLARLGGGVVAADEGGVILATGRRSLADAVAHVDYALASLRRREGGLYALLQLAPVRWWHALLFKDR